MRKILQIEKKNSSCLDTPKKTPLESNQVIVRVERIDYGTMPESIPSKDPPIDCSDTLDENQQKRSRRNSPVKPTKKKNERTKKKSDKVCCNFPLEFD